MRKLLKQQLGSVATGDLLVNPDSKDALLTMTENPVVTGTEAMFVKFILNSFFLIDKPKDIKSVVSKQDSKLQITSPIRKAKSVANLTSIQIPTNIPVTKGLL